jgi:Nif-specific regulatory protein
MNAKDGNGLERKILELTVLYEISQLLISHSEPKEVVGPVLDILNSKMGMERGTLTLIDTESHELMIEVAHGLTREEMKKGHYKLGEGVTGTVVERGEPMIIPRVGENPLFLDRTGARNEMRTNKNGRYHLRRVKR